MMASEIIGPDGRMMTVRLLSVTMRLRAGVATVLSGVVWVSLVVPTGCEVT